MRVPPALLRSGKTGRESAARRESTRGHNEGLGASSAVHLPGADVGHLGLWSHKEPLGLRSQDLGEVEESSSPGTRRAPKS